MARRRKPQNRSSQTSSNKSDSKSKSNKVSSAIKKEEIKTEAKEGDEGDKPSPKNDPEWYLQDAPTMEAAANVPFSNPFGAPLDFVENRSRFSSDVATEEVPNSFEPNASNYNRSVAGVCTVNVVPCFGDNKDQNDPLNVCANALYSKIRIKNNGRKNYDPADLLIYAMTFGDIYAFTIWCNRLYNYAFMYSQRNYFIGRDLINANGVSHSDMVQNLANFRYWLNSFINKISSFAVPADIYYFRRRIFMFGNFYIENPYGNVKDQLYQFAPMGFYKFALDPTGKGMLMLQPWQHNLNTLATVEDIMAYGNNLLSGISGDEDFGLMSGDILRAYEGNIIGLPSIGEEGGILPVYDPVVLSQFKNTQLVHVDFNAEYKFDPDSDESFRSGMLMQDAKGNLVSRYFVEDNAWQSQLIAGTGKLISVENPTPGVGDVVEATRLMVAAKGFQTLDANPSIGERRMYVVGGTDLAVAVTYLYYQGNGALTSYGDTHSVISYADITNPESLINRLCNCQFKYAPIMYLATTMVEEGVMKVARFDMISNLDNYAYIGNDQLVRIHDAANLSLFYVPGVAKLVSGLQR